MDAQKIIKKVKEFFKRMVCSHEWEYLEPTAYSYPYRKCRKCGERMEAFEMSTNWVRKHMGVL